MKIVAVSDMHVGSLVGLADPAETPTKDAAAPVREALFECWKESAAGEWHAPDALIVNGDAIDGPNRKNGGCGTWTNDFLEQCEHAADLIRMWDAKRIYVIRGSGYHVSPANSGLQVEEYMARRLNAEEYPGQDRVKPGHRDRSGWSWYLHFDGVTFHASHKIAVSRVFHYQSTPTARQMLQAKLNDAMRHLGPEMKTRVVLRGHAHYFNHVEYSGSDGYVLPCWKGQDEFGLSNGPLDISPDIGFVGFKVEGGKYAATRKLWGLSAIQTPPLTRVNHSGGGADGDLPTKAPKRNRRGAKGGE